MSDSTTTTATNINYDILEKEPLSVWRCQGAFNVKPVNKNDFGIFYTGDTYIVVKQLTKLGSTTPTGYNIHYWLGKEASDDEKATAASRVTDFEEHLKGEKFVIKEVQGQESEKFRSYFMPSITILKGGADSGFNIRAPEKYSPRLLHVVKIGNQRGRKGIEIFEMSACDASELNSGDVFILDAGLLIFQWNGKASQPFERNKASEMLRAMDSARSEKAETVVLDEGTDDDERFWNLLGGRKPIKSSAAEVGTSSSAAADGVAEDEKPKKCRKMFRLSDTTGSLEFTEVEFHRSSLDENDVFIIDLGDCLFVWIGGKSTEDEKRSAMKFAERYLTSLGRPSWLNVTRIVQGQVNPRLEAALNWADLLKIQAAKGREEQAASRIQAWFRGRLSKKKWTELLEKHRREKKEEEERKNCEAEDEEARRQQKLKEEQEEAERLRKQKEKEEAAAAAAAAAEEEAKRKAEEEEEAEAKRKAEEERKRKQAEEEAAAASSKHERTNSSSNNSEREEEKQEKQQEEPKPKEEPAVIVPEENKEQQPKPAKQQEEQQQQPAQLTEVSLDDGKNKDKNKEKKNECCKCIIS